MKNKKIILSIICIFIISLLLVVIIKNDRKEYVMYDGATLALTLDGNPVKSFPNDSSKYNVSVVCNGGSGKYQPVKTLNDSGEETNNYEMKFTIDNIDENGAKCNIDFTTLTDNNKPDYLLKAKIENTDEIDKIIRTETKKLENESTYHIATMETTSDSVDAFLWDDTNKTWTSQNHTHSTTTNGGIGMEFTVPADDYQLCYKMSSEKNYDYGIVSVDGTQKFTTKGKSASRYCEDLGTLTSSNVIRISYRKDGSTSSGDDNIIFYLLKSEEINDYRYSGKQPDNWIWFNNELWRIIGVTPVCLEASCGTQTTSLVKIIRAESIGGISYDDGNDTNVWGSNSLYTVLNSYYYGKQNATGITQCNGSVCDYTGIGISNDANDYYGRMVKEVYWNSGKYDSDYTPAGCYASETATQTKSGFVGLMGASDYGYAAGTQWYDTSLLVSSDITSTNWLYGQGAEWLLFRSDSPTEYYVGGSKLVDSRGDRHYTVRPVVYLNSEVYVISGDGTKSNPYILGM